MGKLTALSTLVSIMSRLLRSETQGRRPGLHEIMAASE